MKRRITAITPQKRNPRRVNIYLDGEFAFGLEKMVAARLQIGQELSDDEIAQLQVADAYETAYQQALRYCAYRPRTEHEVRLYLAKRDLSEERVEEIIARLRELGLVDDAHYAREWVESRAIFRPRGKWALRQEMRAKGLPPEAIEQALSAVDEAELAARALEKALRRYRDLPENEKRRKVTAYLARRGFSPETVKAVLASHSPDTHPDSPLADAAEDIP